MNRGFIISKEGIDGGGKSTIIKETEKYLKEKGLKYIVTREPGGVNISEQIRNIN
ncbi:hypothetical protein KQI89_00080 [Clostridium sp. MSJ-4]|uniref:Thymidylate kinase-like domain-containing protein n=1 Tax=Clostridium simiarum TaxID=2841506 RepID=A0ABS6EWX9_9CLOT|nr:hypothetical protein [Clostridium simiarum]MBU5590154.1 hypothetical protein [Clostridium simiarum]